ncbi:MAG: TIM-barrel domain-containing protein [Pseudomonadota bacterium]
MAGNNHPSKSADPFVPNWAEIDPIALLEPPRVQPNGSVVLTTSAGDLALYLFQSGFRIRCANANLDRYDIVQSEPPMHDMTIETSDEHVTVHGGDLQLTLARNPLSFEFSYRGQVKLRSARDAHFARRHRLPPLARHQGTWLWSLDLDPEEPIYGLGEKWSALNKRGQWLRSFNEDALGVNAEASYKNTPFLWSPRGWGCFCHTPAAVSHSVGFAPWSQRAYVGRLEDAVLDLWFFGGDTPQDILTQYTALTGRAKQPPVWSLGAILSRAYYRTADELLDAAREVRARGLPCDTITLDGRAWQDTDTRFAFEWDASRYPDPERVIAELKALSFRVCLWEYPLIALANPLHEELAAKKYLLTDRRTGEPYRYCWDRGPFGEVLTPLPDSGILDFTNPDAYAFWRDAHKPLFDLGVDMIKADFGEQLTDENMLASSGDHGLRLHNVYSLLYNRCVFEAAERYGKTGAFLFSRAAWSGSHRYPSQWGGDPQADWEGLAASLRGALSWGLSGGPFYASDIGGFYADERDPELYVRWAQATAFSAHMRFHGIGPREPWSYGPEADEVVRKVLKLRYRLLPYLWRSVCESCASGVPFQRAMVLVFPEDRLAWGFEHQFMCGSDLLVAPCVRADRTVEFYLPAGDWTRFPDGGAYAGGRRYEETVPLDTVLVFARSSTEIPLGEQRDTCPDTKPVATGSWNATSPEDIVL